MVRAWLTLLGYALQIYFDFSGYSDMAIGLRTPLRDRAAQELRFAVQGGVAQRLLAPLAHHAVTLAARLPLYSLGGNRCTPARQKLNLMATMVLGGLWHGANWTFAAWGCWHGLLLIVHHAVPAWEQRVTLFWRRNITFGLVTLGWVFFRSDTFGQAGQWFAALVGAHGLVAGWSSQTAALLALVLIRLVIVRGFRNSLEIDLERIGPDATDRPGLRDGGRHLSHELPIEIPLLSVLDDEGLHRRAARPARGWCRRQCGGDRRASLHRPGHRHDALPQRRRSTGEEGRHHAATTPARGRVRLEPGAGDHPSRGRCLRRSVPECGRRRRCGRGLRGPVAGARAARQGAGGRVVLRRSVGVQPEPAATPVAFAGARGRRLPGRVGGGAPVPTTVEEIRYRWDAFTELFSFNVLRASARDLRRLWRVRARSAEVAAAIADEDYGRYWTTLPAAGCAVAPSSMAGRVAGSPIPSGTSVAPPGSSVSGRP